MQKATESIIKGIAIAPSNSMIANGMHNRLSTSIQVYFFFRCSIDEPKINFIASYIIRSLQLQLLWLHNYFLASCLLCLFMHSKVSPECTSSKFRIDKRIIRHLHRVYWWISSIHVDALHVFDQFSLITIEQYPFFWFQHISILMYRCVHFTYDWLHEFFGLCSRYAKNVRHGDATMHQRRTNCNIAVRRRNEHYFHITDVFGWKNRNWKIRACGQKSMAKKIKRSD